MAESIHSDVNRRHDFVYLFDVADGNPNGDPDAGNLPRVDPETMQGLVTDVALKRKVRDYVDAVRGEHDHFKIYVQSGTALNTQHERAYSALGLKSTGAKQKASDVEKAREWMCKDFYDIRMFGAVMTTGVNCGQVRGPLQLTFARSIDKIVPLDLSITRVAVTRVQDTEVVVSEEGGEGEGGKRTEMGRKAMVPYGLYLAHGFFNPHFAKQTGADREDLELFWSALQNMFDLDRSAARGMMAVQGLYVFSHESPLGNAPAQRLFERITVTRKPEVKTPRSFGDYEVKVNAENFPAAVQLARLAG
ncbi:MAG TPA: type I-C CRISPR-associated protein Cas7/Csd2 [Candidatus Binataceae bacterium]|nr:type I-C CRISPR-associated protein Cas7/Csd2 [Candidatus Binataceae bacterium]HVB80032.1 type I-C CRISPR-associated protein Cas7/Csd2 [Candidatus Binataceae bacterium]